MSALYVWFSRISKPPTVQDEGEFEVVLGFNPSYFSAEGNGRELV